jgi:hypothetical protein
LLMRTWYSISPPRSTVRGGATFLSPTLLGGGVP